MKNSYNIESLKNVKLVLLFLILVIIPSYDYADTIFSDSFSGSYPGSWYIGHDGGGGSYAWAWPNGYAHEYSNPSGGQYYYPNDLHVYMERRYVNLSGYSSATLSFYYIVDTEAGFDFFTVNVRDEYGNWHEMFRTSGENDLSWISKTINLDQFAGQSGIYIQFRFDSDGSVCGSPYDGVFVDVVQLTAEGGGDFYEPDNSYSEANAQAHNTCSLLRSINPADDQDWIYFDLSTTSNVIVYTYGPSGDTRMWLYDSSLNLIEYDDDDGDGNFSRIQREVTNSLAPGRYYVKIDEYGNDNIIPEYFIDLSVEAYNPAYPDLIPYQPSGWPDKIIISNTTGTNSESVIYANQTSYIDYSVLNNGNDDTGVGFYVEIWDDTTGERIRRGYYSSSLAAGYFYQQEDSQWTFVQSGWHTIRIKVDADNNVSNESNEGNNEYTRQVYVNPAPTYPDLMPYQPSGWPSKIIISNTSGTNIDSSIYVNQTAYIDYAVLNNGNGDTGVGFYVELWDDTTGEQIRRGYRSDSLPAYNFYQQEDSQWTFTQAGWHTIRIKVDADNDVSNESNEGNNEYTRQVFITNVEINENEIPGASNIPSSVPTYLNSNEMYNIGSAGDAGICFATAITDILAYWDRSPYSGIIYWNLVDHGKAPLTQDDLPQSPGHNQADVSSLVVNIGTRYYVNHQAQDSIVEDVCNTENNLGFNATFFNPVTSENDKITYFNTITSDIDAGRPIKAGSLGTYFSGAHSIPVIGYKEFEDSLGNEIYIHVNQGDTNSGYVNFFDPSWGALNLVRIVPGGTPNDHYEDLNGQDDDSQANAKWLFPGDVYEFRQTHNFKAGLLGIGNDMQDWVKFTATAGRQYTIQTRNLGANCDTTLMIDWDGATYCIFDDDGGDEPRASKIVWDCASDTTVYILVTEYYGRVGHDTNYDIEVTYSNIVVPQTPTPISPYDNEYIYTLTPLFEWSAFQDGGNGATQTGYQLRVRCDTDGDIVVYDTGFISSTSGQTHFYTPGAYSGNDPVTEEPRFSEPLQWGKHYHWHVRYRDSNGRWSAWSADDPNPHQDFYTQLPTYTLNISIYPSGAGTVIKNPDKVLYNQNEIVQLTAIPAAGYTFVGWNGDIISTSNPIYVTMNSNKNLTANFVPITYTLNVSVNPAGSGNVTKNPDKSAYNYNEVVQLTANPVAGFAFSGWSGDVISTNNPVSVAMNSNKNITANFIPITYTLNVSVNPAGSGNVTRNPDKSSYNYNEVVQLTASPVAGYTFSSWSGSVSSTANPLTVTMNSNKSITANFTPITYTLDVSVNPAGSGSITKNPNKSVYNPNEVVQLTASPAAGYIFSNWSGSVSSTANPLSVTMNSNKSITANFTPITYTLDVNVNPAGSGNVTKNPNKSSYNYYEVVQLTASPAAGYTFSSWSGSVSSTANPLSVTMNSNKSITANFTPLTYTLNLNANPADGGSVTSNPSKAYYNHNEVVQLTASPAVRYSFTGWSGDASGTTNPLSITMDSNKTITANFSMMTRTLTVNVNPNGSGSVTKNPDKSVYEYNEVVQLTATPAAGYTFTGWSGDASGTTNPLSVTMNADKNITANFTPTTYTLSVDVNPASSGSVTKNPEKAAYDYNEIVQLTAAPSPGYSFVSWSGDASGTANPLSVTMNANKTITANFAPPGSLSVVPVDDLNSSGTPGGPFTPSSIIYTVKNTGDTAIDFTVTKSAAWITLSNTGQALTPDQSVSVTVSINDNANSMAIGTFSDSVIFTNTTNGNGNTTRNAVLNISEQKSITVTSPNGGESWNVGSIQDITWTSTGMDAGSKLSIQYSTNNGVSWTSISTSTPNDGSYSWRVKDTPSSNCLIRISGSTNDTGPSDVSDSIFSIVPPSTIIITSPNGGEILSVGTKHEVTWTSAGSENIGNVRIAYSTNRGSSWTTIVTSTVNDSSYLWTVPNTLSNNCLVRIIGLDKDIHPTDVSDKVFSIVSPSSIKVTSPNGGESLRAGTTHEITWAKAGTENFDNVKIEYSANNGSSWIEIIADTTNNGSYVWTIPDSPSDICLVRVSDIDGDPADVSDAVFTITSPPSITLTSPNGGERWEAGTSHHITWTSTGYPGNLKIEYSTDNGASWIYIELSTPDDGIFNWAVPDTPADNCLVRISTSSADQSVSDVSDDIFSIVPPSSPSITVTTPNGSEQLKVGSIHQISWTTIGTVDNIKIEYSTNSGTSWTEVVSSISNIGNFEWSVPDTTSGNCLVRISETDGEPSDISDSEFSIVPPSSANVTVTSPNGAEILEIGSTHEITWISSGMGDSDNVIIRYSVDSGISWTDIVISPVNNCSYNWTVPDNPSDNCLVHICGNDQDEEVLDVSDAEFSIVLPSSGTITVTSPNGGETLTEGSTHEITWTSTGTVNNVMIEYSTNRGVSWSGIIESITNTGTYNWTIPNTPADECLVRISALDADKDPSDQSDGLFSIISASLDMTAPNGGEILKPGENFLITWKNDAKIKNIKLEYSPDNGSTYLTINDRIPDNGCYNWQVPHHISSNCLVRVSNANGWTPAQHILQYELKFKIPSSGLLTTASGEIFTVCFGDVLSEPSKDFMSKISIIREAYGINCVQFNDIIKKLPQTQPVFNRWNRLKVLLNQETLSISLWLNGQMIFENLPLKSGSIFFPAVSFSIEAGNTGSPTSVEIDDFIVGILDSWGIVNETRFVSLFTEDFENFEAGAFPVEANNGWKTTGFLDRKKMQKDPSEKKETCILISRDFISGRKCLKIKAIEENQVTVIKYFNIPGYFPFATSDKPFEIK